jgi:hypothetical protein
VRKSKGILRNLPEARISHEDSIHQSAKSKDIHRDSSQQSAGSQDIHGDSTQKSAGIEDFPRAIIHSNLPKVRISKRILRSNLPKRRIIHEDYTQQSPEIEGDFSEINHFLLLISFGKAGQLFMTNVSVLLVCLPRLHISLSVCLPVCLSVNLLSICPIPRLLRNSLQFNTLVPSPTVRL